MFVWMQCCMTTQLIIPRLCFTNQPIHKNQGPCAYKTCELLSMISGSRLTHSLGTNDNHGHGEAYNSGLDHPRVPPDLPSKAVKAEVRKAAVSDVPLSSKYKAGTIIWQYVIVYDFHHSKSRSALQVTPYARHDKRRRQRDVQRLSVKVCIRCYR